MEGKKSSMEEQLENHTQYWNLISTIDNVCGRFFCNEENCLYMDDVVSALDRVRDCWLQEQIKWQIRNKEDGFDDECRKKEMEEFIEGYLERRNK